MRRVDGYKYDMSLKQIAKELFDYSKMDNDDIRLLDKPKTIDFSIIPVIDPSCNIPLNNDPQEPHKMMHMVVIKQRKR
jgi:hypothetical protein